MRLRTLSTALLVTGLAAGRVAAQIPGAELNQIQVTRESLLDLQRRLEEASSSSSYSGELRARARELAERVRRRLADGDFQAGDRVYLQVQGETSLTDTFVVREGQVLRLPNVGDLPVQGVLRSELGAHLTRELARYVRDPVVSVRSLIRITVTGGVTNQGFYSVPVDVGINEVLLLAGGVSATAVLDRMIIWRGNEILFQGEQVTRIITIGASLDAIGFQAGDRLDVPSSVPRNWWQVVQTFNGLIALTFSIIAISKSF